MLIMIETDDDAVIKVGLVQNRLRLMVMRPDVPPTEVWMTQEQALDVANALYKLQSEILEYLDKEQTWNIF